MQFSNDELYTMNTLLGNRNTILNVDFIDGESHIKNGIKSLEERQLITNNVVVSEPISDEFLCYLKYLSDYINSDKYLFINNCAIVRKNNYFIYLIRQANNYELDTMTIYDLIDLLIEKIPNLTKLDDFVQRDLGLDEIALNLYQNYEYIEFIYMENGKIIDNYGIIDVDLEFGIIKLFGQPINSFLISAPKLYKEVFSFFGYKKLKSYI